MDYTGLQQTVFRLRREDPAWEIIVLGQSLSGRSLYGLETGKGPRKVLFCGAFHGMEHITSSLLLRYAEDLSKEGRSKTLPCRLTVVPMINPDGAEIQQKGSRAAIRCEELVERCSGGDTYHWQANGRGVDLNHNFDADWKALRQREEQAGIVGPAKTRFGGYFPESEPETRALARFCRERQFDLAAAFHSQGEEIYWRYGKHTSRESEEIVRQMARLSGYRPADPEGLAAGGGFKDWFLDYFHRPAFTIEVGKGKNPLPESDLDGIYEKVRPMLDFLTGCPK